MEETKRLEELWKEYHENRLAHAFLLETNDMDKCLEHLFSFLSVINEVHDKEEDEKLKNLIFTKQLPSLVVIEPDGQNIRKEQILELKRCFQTKPIFSKYNMYVILNAEALNASSANTMLKFLEEPEDNILGFFLTNNKENMIDTIKSRCQIILDYYDSSLEQIPSVWQGIAKSFINEYEVSGRDAILYQKNVILPLVPSRKELNYLFQSIFKIYESLYFAKLNHLEVNEEYQEFPFLPKKDALYFLKQMDYLAKLLDELNYNVNVNLFLDRFILESR